jgi:hypothetical protein
MVDSVRAAAYPGLLYRSIADAPRNPEHRGGQLGHWMCRASALTRPGRLNP